MNVFIAGGTSGIGYSLSRLYLQKGCKVGICGRDLARCPEPKLPNLHIFRADVCDAVSLSSAIDDFLINDRNLDIFINCAGSYAEDVAGNITYFEAEEMLRTNILGTVNCFEAARSVMKNTRGKIAVIASVSGILDYENSSLYTKTKRSVIQIADAYRRALKPFGISVTTIAPGYIDTEKLRQLNDNNLSKKPFLTDVESAAILICEAIDQEKKLVIFPVKMKWMMTLLSILPSPILNLIMYRKAKWMTKD